MTTHPSGLIDVHHHAIPAWYRETLLHHFPAAFAEMMPHWSPEADLALMQRQGIATAILSMTFLSSGASSRHLNEDLATIAHQDPQHFGAFGVLPLPDVQAATSEAIYCLDTLKMDGIALLSNYEGFYLSDGASDELLAELNRRSAVVFVHPVNSPEGTREGFLSGHYEFALETTRAIGLLLVKGKLTQYPHIRWILSHAGGALPFVAHRLIVSLALNPDAQHGPATDPVIAQHVREEIANLYYDTAIAGDAWPLSLLRQVTSSSHILFGTDAGAATEAFVAENTQGLFTYTSFSPEEQRQIASENMRALFPRLQSH